MDDEAREAKPRVVYDMKMPPLAAQAPTPEPSEAEFCVRFKARMLARCAPRTHFDDGGSISEYADEAAPTYWETDWQREEGPEACADADMSYWGEE